MKTGLVLEGGAMRGLFTCGVTDYLMENNITFDGMVGVSAGAAFGCNIKSRQNGRALRYNLRFARDKRYCSWKNLITTGNIFHAKFCWHTVPEELDIFDVQAFNANPMEFHLVATDVDSGKPFYKKLDSCDYNGIEWMRASASMPLVSTPVSLEGHRYLDGGMSDSIPLEYFESQGYTKNVVILTQPEHFVKKPSGAMPLMKLALHRHPALVQTIQNRHIMYNKEVAHVEEQAKNGSVFLIRPEAPLNISRTCREPSELQRVYDLGRALAVKLLPDLKSWLSK